MTDNNRALRLSSELGGTEGTYQTEGEVEVVFGEMDGYLYTLLGSSYGVVVLQVGFPPGQDPRRVAKALIEDEALKTCIGQARGSMLSEDSLQVEDDGLQIPRPGGWGLLPAGMSPVSICEPRWSYVMPSINPTCAQPA